MSSHIYKSSDWKLWTYQPQPGSFVLDFSQLNGPDVLGNSTDGLAVSSYEVSELTISSGGTMDFGVIHSMNPEIAQIVVNVRNFTTDVINDFYVGTKIAISVDNPSGFANPYTYFFSGVIDSAVVDVLPGQDFSTINISARSYSSLQLNTDIALTKNETDTKGFLISNAVANAGSFVSIEFSPLNFKGTARESKSLGEWLTDLALCGFMQMRDTVRPYFVQQPNISDPTTWTIEWSDWIEMFIAKETSIFAYTETLTGNEITGLQLDWSGAGSPTGVTLTNYTDSEIVYQYGSTTADAGGAVSYNATVDVKNLTQMTAIGQQLLAMNKAFQPIQITTTTAVNNQEIDWKIIDVSGVGSFIPTPLYPQKIYNIGETIFIDMPEYGVNEVPLLITGREINVDPDNWTTTYTLWKGFTN
jgi:hypothetical protein